ncbi:helix-turn-helix domain-containing protein [Paenibacillus agri]|nr:helix-turn-helix domain-containing protein [Paenibacillus agri]
MKYDPSPCDTDELIDAMKWSKSRLSHHLTRMQKRGLIERKPLASEPSVLLVITTSER